jgi:hypothetical protein
VVSDFRPRCYLDHSEPSQIQSRVPCYTSPNSVLEQPAKILQAFVLVLYSVMDTYPGYVLHIYPTRLQATRSL